MHHLDGFGEDHDIVWVVDEVTELVLCRVGLFRLGRGRAGVRRGSWFDPVHVDTASVARQIQTYKDEKANELLEQISSEPGRYATKEDLAARDDKLVAMIRPLLEYVSAQRGKSSGYSASWVFVGQAISTFVGLVAVVLVLT